MWNVHLRFRVTLFPSENVFCFEFNSKCLKIDWSNTREIVCLKRCWINESAKRDQLPNTYSIGVPSETFCPQVEYFKYQFGVVVCDCVLSLILNVPFVWNGGQEDPWKYAGGFSAWRLKHFRSIGCMISYMIRISEHFRTNNIKRYACLFFGCTSVKYLIHVPNLDRHFLPLCMVGF